MPGSVTWVDAHGIRDGLAFLLRNIDPLVWQFSPVSSFHLSADDLSDLEHLCKELAELYASRSGRAVEFALRRLSLSAERTTPEDHLVDLMIAAEGLFLSGERDELSFKLGVRAAKFLESEHLGARSVYETLTSAYGVRSRIVHGEQPRNVKVAGHEMTVSMLTGSVETILRPAARRAIAAAIGGEILEARCTGRTCFSRPPGGTKPTHPSRDGSHPGARIAD